MSTESIVASSNPSNEVAVVGGRTRRASAGGLARMLLLSLLYAAIAAGAVWGGGKVRRWAWDYARPIRQNELQSAFSWGSWGAQHGMRNTYHHLAAGSGMENAERVDCPPLQLFVVTRWARWAHEHGKDVAGGSYEAAAPLLRFSMGLELLGAIGAFLLARHWVVRSRAIGQPRRFFDGWAAGMAAALLLWFNPALLTSAHGWPAWDVWVIPFVLWAMLLGCWERWLWSGMVLGIGALLKAEVAFAVPVFVLWTLLSGRWRGMIGAIVGVLFAMALGVSPWMLTYVPNPTAPDVRSLDLHAIAWVLGVTFSTLLLSLITRVPLFRKRSSEPAAAAEPAGAAPSADAATASPPGADTLSTAHLVWWGVLVMVAAAVVIWPFFPAQNRHLLPVGSSAAALLVIATLMGRRQQPIVLCATLAAALLLCMPLFHGSHDWLKVGFGYDEPARAATLDTKTASNLSAMLRGPHGVRDDDQLFTIPSTLEIGHHVPAIHWLREPWKVTVRELLIAIYCFTLLLSGIGMAMQYRRNDARFLVAAIAPWLLLFCVLPGVPARYLLYAAGLGCTLTAVSVGMTLLNLFLMATAWAMTLHTMLLRTSDGANFASNISPGFGSKLLVFLERTHPDLAWPLLLCAAIFLYYGLSTRRKQLYAAAEPARSSIAEPAAAAVEAPVVRLISPSRPAAVPGPTPAPAQ